MKEIPNEIKEKAKKLHSNQNLKYCEIANLCNISITTLNTIYRQYFIDGVLKPRRPEFALKPRTPNGQGKGKYVKKGYNYNPINKRITDEMIEEMATDYYEKGLTAKDVMKKYNAHPMQMQRMRKKYSSIYGKKRRVKKMVFKYETEHLSCVKVNESYHIYEKLGSKLVAVYYNKRSMKLSPEFPSPETSYQWFDEMCEIVTMLYELGE